jgi:crossover junction endodeoxyribonuclease RuvC
MCRTLGIDPGAAGAVAVVEGGKLVAVHDMPAIEVRGKRRVDGAALAAIVRALAPAAAVVELVGAMPGQGVSSMFAFGKATGIVLGVLAGLGIPVTEVAPVQWKRALRVPADKGGARLRASQLFPTAAAHWQRVKDDGRAEAAMIALYGERLSRPEIEW